MTPVGQPYRAAGPVSLRSLLTTLILGTVTALLGALIVWLWELSPIPTLVILTQVFQGLFIGIALMFMVGRLKMRNPRLLMVIGFSCGLGSVAMVHYGHYLHLVDQAVDVRRQRIESSAELNAAEKAEAIATVEQNPTAVANAMLAMATGHSGVLGSLMLRAEEGYYIKTMHVTGWGVWILWGFEALMVACFAAAMAAARASKPFCEDCGDWCEESVTPRIFPADTSAPLIEAIQLDGREQLAAVLARPDESLGALVRVRVTLHSCPTCELTFADVVQKTDKVVNGKTETASKDLVRHVRVSPEMAAMLRVGHVEVSEPEPEAEAFADAD